MNCTHHWTVTSPCPDCQQDELRREMVINAKLNDEIAELRAEVEGHRKAQAAVYLALGARETDRTKWPEQIKAMREAIAAWPVATHNSGCAPMQDGGPCYCGTFKLNRARAEARKLARLEAE